MTPAFTVAESLTQTRADAIARTRRHADQCVLLAVVTSTDVAATLIDQAVELHAILRPTPLAA